MQAFSTTVPLLARGEAPGMGIWLAAIAFAAVCVIMMLVVLIQKPKGGGLSGAFGGGAGGGSSQAFVGGGIGNVLTVVTVVLFIAFLMLAGGMTLAINAGDEVPEVEIQEEQLEKPEGEDAPEGEVTLPPVEADPDAESADQPADESAEEPAAEPEGDATTAPDAEGSEGASESPEPVTPTE